MIQVESVELEGYGIRLEPLHIGHTSELQKVAAKCNHKELWFTRVPEPDTVGDYIRQALEQKAQGHRVSWVVRDAASMRVVGCTSYHDIMSLINRVEIGWTWYDPDVRRTFVNTACKLVLLSHAFDTLGCDVVGLRTDISNITSRTAIAALGARQDGIIRHHRLNVNGTIGDTVMFSIIKPEWPDIQERLHDRLRRHSLRSTTNT